MSKVMWEEWIAQGETLFGTDRMKWKFVCSSKSCSRIQSAESIKEQMEKGEPSLRYGLLEDGHRLSPDSACYSPTCNWVAGGLFHSGKLIIHDPEKPYNPQTLENCGYIFWFEGEKQ